MLSPSQLQHILKLYKVYLRKGYTAEHAFKEIGQLYDRSEATIRNLVYRLTADTTGVAQSYIKSNALKMAMKVVREGSVAQHMDILERPNIGVLAPKKQSSEGSRGFFLTVQADSCGAVKASVGMIEGGAAPLQEEKASDDDLLFQDAQETLAGGLPTGLGEGSQPVVDLIPEDEKDRLGRWSYAKSAEGRAAMSEFAARREGPRGPGQSKAYKEAVEKARKRIEAAKV